MEDPGAVGSSAPPGDNGAETTSHSEPHGSTSRSNQREGEGTSQNLSATVDGQLMLNPNATQSEDQTTPSLQTGELAVVQAYDSNNAQLVPYVNPDLERSDLSEQWKLCETGDVFLVSISEAEGTCFKAQDQRTRLPQQISYFASDCWFAHIIPGRSKFSFIDPTVIFQYSKGDRHDGVIYYHEKRYREGEGVIREARVQSDLLIKENTKSSTTREEAKS